MKKYLTLLMSAILLPVTVCAATVATPEANESLDAALKAAAASFLSSSKVDWVKRLQSEEHKVDSAAGVFQTSFYAISTQDFPQHPICPSNMDKAQCKANTDLFNARKKFVQELLQKNEVLKKYKLFVSQPSDLYGLTDKEMSYLSGFLVQPVEEGEIGDSYYNPHQVTKPQNGVIEVKLLTSGIRPMRLRMDARKRTVFFFHD